MGCIPLMIFPEEQPSYIHIHCIILELLSDIASIQIKASFGSGTASTFYSIAMDTARIDETVNTGFVTTVENCTCTDNTIGKKAFTFSNLMGPAVMFSGQKHPQIIFRNKGKHI